jgi:predicted nucleic acid-binding protein
MILVDTSVWIRYLAGKEPFLSGLRALLRRGDVVGHELVFGELLMGDAGGRLKLLADYPRMVHAATLAHAEVVEFVRRRRLHGRGLGWIDAHLLAAVIVEHHRLWTADPRFEAIANELGVAHAR